MVFRKIEGKTNEEYQKENSWTTQRNGVTYAFLMHSEKEGIRETHGKLKLNVHWTPTGDEPMERWMDG